MSLAAGAVAGAFGRVALLDIDRPVLAHAHPHAHVLFKIGGADSRFRVGGRLWPLTDETAILVNSWEVHDYPHAADEPKSLVLALYIEPAWLREIDAGFAACSLRGFFPKPCVTVPRGLGRLFHDAAESAAGSQETATTHTELLASLMSEVILRFAERRLRGNAPTAEGLPVRDRRIRRSVELMRNGNARWTMDRLAREAALSRAHFFELFKAETGMSPRTFLNSLRMEESHRALLDGTTSLGETSHRLGFAAPAHFSRFFRDHVGVAPSEFRRALSRHAAPDQGVLIALGRRT